MRFNDIFQNLTASFFDMNDSYKRIWKGIGLELIFFISYGFFYGLIVVNGIGNNLANLGAFAISKQKELSNGYMGLIMSNQNFKYILFLSCLFAILVYLLYCFLQGHTWNHYLSFYNKHSNKGFIKKFCLINIFWFSIFCLLSVIDFFFYFIDTVGQRLEPSGIYFMGYIMTALFILLFYFAFISYALVSKHSVWKSIGKSFSLGIRKILWLALSFLIITLCMLIIGYISMFQNIIIGIIIGLAWTGLIFIRRIKNVVIWQLATAIIGTMIIFGIFKFAGEEFQFNFIFISLLFFMPMLGMARIFLGKVVNKLETE